MSNEAKEIVRIIENRPDLTEMILQLVIDQAVRSGIPHEVCQSVLKS